MSNDRCPLCGRAPRGLWKKKLLATKVGEVFSVHDRSQAISAQQRGRELGMKVRTWREDDLYWVKRDA